MHIDIVIFNRYNHAVTSATRHFISLISICKKYESNFKEISKLHLLVVIYECTSGQRKHRDHISTTVVVIYVFLFYHDGRHRHAENLFYI